MTGTILRQARLGLISLTLLAGQAGAAELPKIAVVATGGTIAMKLDPTTHAPVPALSGEDLVSAVPKLKDIATVAVTEFSNVPSDYMGPDRWPALSRKVDEILADPGVRGVIVLHGTDTLDQTAYFLDLTLKSDKPVVLVGAQRNASDWDADGPRNLLNAARQILADGSVGMGVTVTLNHRINAAREVRKTHTSNVETFNSGDAGILGYVDEDRVVFSRKSLRRQTLPLPERMPRIDLVSMYAGADGSQVRHAAETGAEAIVVEAYGWGNMNAEMHDAIAEVIAKGVPVIVATKVYDGRALPVYGFKGGGNTLLKAGAVFAGDLTPDKARILTLIALPTTKDRAALQSLFDK
ncbi:asparaginase [Methylobacterium dankookense]|uniref:L-asparaginase n=1 Tax=Methylobacterium dankookense TaxID=560405 RepID=A0A564G3T3_9HYPH|nr:asparaginase [Methylobacterium dankookense]GJD59205.1 L-asparaginase [Methylobacterium dankookense]VUF14957.1 L-asparaginase [Methylobacterium dankookense]